MPDESCRKCGGLLLNYSLCGKCKASTRFICRICGLITPEQFHEYVCFNLVTHDEKIIPYPIKDMHAHTVFKKLNTH